MPRDFRLYLDDILEAIHQIRTYMADTKIPQQVAIFDNRPKPQDEMPAKKKICKKTNGYEPPNLGKAIRLPVPDFSDPDRPPV
ncbi:MAG: hypothetical protein A2X96_07620 [Syntrophobacterales bacterium GWC2_56_13]|nr:MAG: hypothetical protein A2X96_07620 [Syntrophobacterales bacterium GWC2_56_13]